MVLSIRAHVLQQPLHWSIRAKPLLLGALETHASLDELTSVAEELKRRVTQEDPRTGFPLSLYCSVGRAGVEGDLTQEEEEGVQNQLSAYELALTGRGIASASTFVSRMESATCWRWERTSRGGSRWPTPARRTPGSAAPWCSLMKSTRTCTPAGSAGSCAGGVHHPAGRVPARGASGGHAGAGQQLHSLRGHGCLGNQGAPWREQHCDTRKGDATLSINPLEERCERLVRFLADGSVDSPEPTIQTDLHQTLNLNSAQLRNNRKKLLDAFLDAMHRKHSGATWSEDVMRRELAHLQQPDERGMLKPYCQAPIYWLKKRMGLSGKPS